MKNFLTFKELSYYNISSLQLDLNIKKVLSFNSLDTVVLSTVMTRKARNVESSFVKMNRLLQVLALQLPHSILTTSFVTLRATITRARLNMFLFFIMNYLRETGRYTLSPVSGLGNQSNFTVRDYTYLANFLNIGYYDYFGWRFPLRVTFNFASSLKSNDFRFFFHLFLINES